MKKDKPVLQDFNLTVKARRSQSPWWVPLAAVNRPSSICSAAFMNRAREESTINGHDYTDLALHAIQSRIGIVLQTPHLFSGTIRG